MTGRRHRVTGLVALMFAALLAALIVVGFVAGRSPGANETDTLVSTIEGVYTNTHTVRGVDGDTTVAEDIVEIVHYDPTHVFLRIATYFDNGASCGLSGIAGLEHHSFVYRIRPFQAYDRACTLTVDATTHALHITDRLEADGTGTCRAFCGVRGSLSEVVFNQKRALLAHDVARVTSSDEYAEAVDEFIRGKAAGGR